MIDYTIPLLEFEKVILILMRIATFMMVAPFFSMNNTPVRTKIGFAFFLTFIIYTSGPEQTVAYSGLFEYAALVIKECIVGLLIGYMTNICMQAIHFAGRIIDMDIGLAMANVMDPTTKEQVGLTGTFYYDFVMLMLLVTDMHLYITRAMIETYEIIPVGEMTINASLYDTVIEFVGNYFIIGFRISLPIFACVLLLNAILGILVKIAPQMNMFVIGIQLKVLTGLGVMFLTVWLLPSISNFVFEQMKYIILKLIEGMSNYG